MRDGVAAAVVVAEHLGEEAPDGGHRVEQPVAERDAVLVERVEDAGLGQGISEGQAEVAREARANLLKRNHRGSQVSGAWSGPGSAVAGEDRAKAARAGIAFFIVRGESWSLTMAATSSGADPCA